MIKIQEAIVVEGRYDKNTLSQVVDAPIFQTNGFSVMKDVEQTELLRTVAKRRGLIVFTDSDGAGFVIRNHLKCAISPEYLKHAYIPDMPGKERRKRAPGKEGLLGVEGMRPDVIVECLKRAGATFVGEESVNTSDITKVDLVELGLSGGKDSSQKRLALLKYMQLPAHMSANAMLQALNLLCTKEELTAIMQNLTE